MRLISALKGFCNILEQLAYGQMLRARVLALSAADAVRRFAVILGVDLIVAVRVPAAAETKGVELYYNNQIVEVRA